MYQFSPMYNARTNVYIYLYTFRYFYIHLDHTHTCLYQISYIEQKKAKQIWKTKIYVYVYECQCLPIFFYIGVFTCVHYLYPSTYIHVCTLGTIYTKQKIFRQNRASMRTCRVKTVVGCLRRCHFTKYLIC